MCLVSNERRENALDNEAHSLFQSCVAMNYLTDKTGFLFCIVSTLLIDPYFFLLFCYFRFFSRDFFVVLLFFSFFQKTLNKLLNSKYVGRLV